VIAVDSLEVRDRIGCYQWAVENFGKPDILGNPEASWRRYADQYYFCSSGDATLFLLRWGGRVYNI